MLLSNRVEIELYNKQYDFVSCQDRFTAMLGGIGSGKTFAGCIKSLYYAKPKTLGLVVAPTYRMLHDATIRTFREVNEELIADYNKTNHEIVLRNGAEIFFRSADDPEKLHGINAHWAWIDEAGLAQKGTWEIVIGRLRAGGGAGPCWITTTPKGRNWLYEKRDMMTIFKAATTDNPYVSQVFVQSLIDNYSGQFLAQEVYGEFAQLEGLIYPDFNRNIHVKRLEKDFNYYHLAIDEGYTNPAVILLIGYDEDKRRHICEEFYQRGKLQSDIITEAMRMAHGRRIEDIAVDAAAAGLIAELRNNGLMARPKKGRVLDGIRAVQDLLKVQDDGLPRLTIDPSCVYTINEFESYIWKEAKDEPVKENDHAMDALRYDTVDQAGNIILFEV